MAPFRSEFTAKLIGPDGFENKKLFSTHEAARQWLTGAGLKAFEGDVERAELYSPDGKLIRSWLRPKFENQRLNQRVALNRAGIPWGQWTF
jgi:hypothetical protein